MKREYGDPKASHSKEDAKCILVQCTLQKRDNVTIVRLWRPAYEVVEV